MIQFDQYFSNGLVQPPASLDTKQNFTTIISATIFHNISQLQVFHIKVTKVVISPAVFFEASHIITAGGLGGCVPRRFLVVFLGH